MKVTKAFKILKMIGMVFYAYILLSILPILVEIADGSYGNHFQYDNKVGVKVNTGILSGCSFPTPYVYSIPMTVMMVFF